MVEHPDRVSDGLRDIGTYDTCPGPGDRTLGYATFGEPGGPTVVAFHGAPGSRYFGALYHDIARRAGVRVLAYDRPGIGRSDHQSGRSVGDCVADVTAILDYLHVDRFGLLGFSAGAPHALACANALPDRVRATALVSPGTPPDGPGRAFATRAMGWSAASLPWLVGPLTRYLLAPNPERLVGQYTDAPVLDMRVADGASMRAVLTADVAGTFQSGVAGFIRELQLFREPWDVDLTAVTGPVDVWHGDADTNVPLAAAKALAERIPGASLTVREGEDHGEVAVRTRRQVLSFLR